MPRSKKRKAVNHPVPQPTARADAGGRTAPWALLIVWAVAVAYVPAYRADFIWDDDDYVEINPLLTEPGGLAEIWDPDSPRNPQYYPLVFTTFWLERRLWGLNAAGYHVVNVALHAANAVLLLLLLTRIGVRGAWLVAAAFALHPVCVESVAWITERKNVLSAFFYFLAALAYLRFDATSRYRWFGAALLGFVLALCSKTVTASLPIALALILWWRRRPITVSRAATLGLMLAVGFGMGLITRAHEIRHVIGTESPLSQLTPLDRLVLAGRAFWFYPQKVLWPADLSFMYSRWQFGPRATGQVLFPLAVLGAAALLFILHRRGTLGRGPVAAAGFYAVTIFPALGFADVAPLRFSWVADHFQYLACIGILLLLVGAGMKLFALDTQSQGFEAADKGPARSTRFRVAAPAAAALLILSGWLTHRQARIYHDRGTLWGDAVKKNPDNWLAQLNYASWLRQHEETMEAIAGYGRVLALCPANSEGAVLASSNLASIYLERGEHDRALEYADGALAISPGYPFALYYRGRALRMIGRLEEAELALRAVVKSKPDPSSGRAAWDVRRRLNDGEVLAVLAEVLGEQGDVEGALEVYDRLVARGPVPHKVHRARMRMLFSGGRYSEALDAARLAVQQLEGSQVSRLQLAWMLASCPDPAFHNGEEALAIATDALAQLGNEDPSALSIMALAQAALGRFAEAEATARRALPIAEQRNQPDTVRQLRTQIDAYAKAQSSPAPP